jgi:outer membrane protein assembly factor BamB
VIHDGKVYIGLGVKSEHASPPRHARFLCIDATRTGDVSPGRSLEQPDSKDSALLWSYGGKIEENPLMRELRKVAGKRVAALLPKRGRLVVFGPTVSTCAVHDGLVYIPEESGYMHCLDARSGRKYWMHDFRTNSRGSPLFVDGKVYICTEDGEVVIFQAGKQLKVLNKIDMDDAVFRTPVVANGVLFVATRSKLYAIAGK